MTPIDLLLTRRSTSVKDLAAPGPRVEELETILRAATRVPDHGKLCPWRILVLSRAGQEKLGAQCEQLFAGQHPDATDKERDHERMRFTRAPLVLAVLSVVKESPKAPAWEQELSAGAVCMNILHACHALGYGAKWLSEWPAFHSEIEATLGGRIAGFIYIGTKTVETEDRERPELKDVVAEFN